MTYKDVLRDQPPRALAAPGAAPLRGAGPDRGWCSRGHARRPDRGPARPGIEGLALLLAQKAEGREPQRDGQDDEEEDEDDGKHGDHTMLLLVGRALPHLYVPRCAPFGEGHREVLLTGEV